MKSGFLRSQKFYIIEPNTRNCDYLPRKTWLHQHSYDDDDDDGDDMT
jgi:hypothetical protein